MLDGRGGEVYPVCPGSGGRASGMVSNVVLGSSHQVEW